MMKSLRAALSFLTILRLPGAAKIEARDLRLATLWFPVVGLVIGAAAAGLDFALASVLPLPVASVIVVIFLVAVSGGLHLDGLADTADGFFSSRPREQMLEIMRDSRTGPMGVAAIVFVLLFKTALLLSVPPPARLGLLLIMPLSGRSALLVSMALLRYARPEGGIASAFVANRLHLVWALVWLLAAGWLSGALTGVAAGLAAAAFASLFALYVYRKIGGFTGDTLGAACELTELVPALVYVIVLHRGSVGI